jgi:hypothetical protein
MYDFSCCIWLGKLKEHVAGMSVPDEKILKRISEPKREEIKRGTQKII